MNSGHLRMLISMDMQERFKEISTARMTNSDLAAYYTKQYGTHVKPNTIDYLRNFLATHFGLKYRVPPTRTATDRANAASMALSQLYKEMTELVTRVEVLEKRLAALETPTTERKIDVAPPAVGGSSSGITPPYVAVDKQAWGRTPRMPAPVQVSESTGTDQEIATIFNQPSERNKWGSMEEFMARHNERNVAGGEIQGENNQEFDPQ
jgi:hypothetical protein